jgi:hypothetical protein
MAAEIAGLVADLEPVGADPGEIDTLREVVDGLARAGAESLPDEVPRGKSASQESGSAASARRRNSAIESSWSCGNSRSDDLSTRPA